MPITIKEIAEICCVSRGTVDRALNGRNDIKEETKNRILQVARENGYAPQFFAQSLATGSTKTIGIIVFDLYNEFFSHIIHAAQKETEKNGYCLQIMVSNKDEVIEKRCIDEMIRRNVDAIIIASVIEEKEYINKLIEKLINIGKPVISVGNKISDEIPFWGINDKLAAQKAAEFIASKGYEKIVFVSPYMLECKSKNAYAVFERYKGFISWAKKNEKLEKYELIDFDYKEKICELIEINKKTAFLCHSDFYALEVLNEIKEKLGSLPKNVGIMGFDNISVLKYINPKITTINYPLEDIGILAVRELIKCTQSKSSINHRYFDFTIVTGNSI